MTSTAALASALALVGASAAALVMKIHAPRMLLPCLLALGVLTSRPTVVGERYPWLGPIIIAVGALGALLRRSQASDSRRPVVAPLVLVVLSGAWIILHAILAPGSEPNAGALAATMLAPAAALAITLRDSQLAQLTSRALVGAVSAVAVLTVLAAAFGAAFGWNTGHITNLPIGYENLDAGLFAPGALIYGTDVGASIPRFLGVGREPGMGAIFIAWSYFAMPSWRHRTLLRLVLVAALLLTQSTAGAGVFAVAVGLYYVFGRERFSPLVAFCAVGLATWLVWLTAFNATFGFVAKQAAGVSYSDRLRATEAGIEAFFSRPFTAQTDAPLSSVNLVASAAAHGAPWVLLMAGLLLWPLVRTRRRSPYFYGALCIAAVMSTSQPIVGATAVIALTLVSGSAVSRQPPPSRPTDATGPRGAHSRSGVPIRR